MVMGVLLTGMNILSAVFMEAKRGFHFQILPAEFVPG